MRILELRVLPEEQADEGFLKELACREAGVPADKFNIKILKRSVDARGRTPRYQLKILIFKKEEPSSIPVVQPLKDVHGKKTVLIVGCGPAGLFAALTLARRGLKPVILERGKMVKERRRSLVQITRYHEVDPDSNYCFGEGGAGAFSDGKLYTRSAKRGNVNSVLQDLVHFGAKEDILVDAHPHIGTDKLPAILENIRKALINAGAEFHFNTRITGIKIQDLPAGKAGSKVKGVIGDGTAFDAEHCILATGHSARDIFEMLHTMGLSLEAKPFAMGVRIEHPQELIDRLQYHCDKRSPYLPPASYSLVTQTGKRGVFSFCMCPGGIIAPCATKPGEIVTNGWSPSGRNNRFSNSGIVAEIRESDLKAYQEYGPLAAMKFQADIEHAAWIAGGKTQSAPAQRLDDFVKGKISADLPESSYKPGIRSADLHSVLPGFVAEALRTGFKEFGRRMKGYYTNEAVLHGVESRTSSPVRIPRVPETLMHPQLTGLYPCGEGAGYAGGIVSAAMDGIRVAEAITEKMKIL